MDGSLPPIPIEEQFRIMADSAPVLIWISGTDKLCYFFNAGWLRFTGRTLAEETGDGWRQGVHPDDLKGCLNIYNRAFDAQQEFKMEYRLRRHDGQYRWVLDNGVPRYAADGTFAGYIGLSTLLGENGMKLSGGEKQRLSIARALLRQPRLLIFDEATSALDSLTEEDITQTIREVSASREQMTILIAHRLSTVMHADTIYVLEKGRIAEEGTHDELLENKGLYYAMWRQQIGERRF